MLEFVLNAKVMIGMNDVADVDITPFVISIERNSSICDILHHYTINLIPEFSTFISELGFWLKPYDPISIDEAGVRVFNGFVSRVRIGRKPAPSFIIEGDHQYKKARDYFNDDANEVSIGENVNFWANALTTRCGITYTCDDAFLGTRGVAPGTEFGLRTVADCLETLAAYAGGYFYMNVSGVLHLHKGQFIHPDRIIIASGGPAWGYDESPADFTTYSGGNAFNAEWYKDDSVTRNHVIVWGWKDPNIPLASGESAWITSERWNDIALPVNKTVLYTTPMIQTQDEADRLANDIAQAFNHYVSIKTFELNGNPNIILGDKCKYYIHTDQLNTIVGNGPITSINSVLDEQGYRTTIKIDETCPKFAGWSVEPRALKRIWIWAAQLGYDQNGNPADAIPEKLIYTDDFGLGGQPTYHIIKGIPSGTIQGMTPLRDDSVMFLSTYIPNAWGHPASERQYRIHSSKTPSVQNGTWKEELKNGDVIPFDPESIVLPRGTASISPITIDTDFFNISPFGSMQAFGTRLYVGVRGIMTIKSGSSTGVFRMQFIATYENGSWTWDPEFVVGTYAPMNTISALVTNHKSYITRSNITLYHFWVGGITDITNNGINMFDNILNNGIRGPASIWCNELTKTADTDVYYFMSPNGRDSWFHGAGFYWAYSPFSAGPPSPAYAEGGWWALRRLTAAGAENVQAPYDKTPGLINRYNASDGSMISSCIPRGDYFGTQVQFVNPKSVGDTTGDLWISPTGAWGTFTKKFSWHAGIVICTDSITPTKMGWFAHYGTRYVSTAGNEPARYSSDGGTTWMSMTGNWWGSNADVLADTAVQNGGNINIIEVQPTFLMNN